ncbi:MAG: glycosyltransferase [Planctomycetes bacterium]|nr:glycosyltransferase [Planctomycetota bacterium]
MKSGIGIFMKEPVPGRVKTRLLDRLGAEESARLYEAFLRDTVEKVSRIECHARCLAYWPEAARSCAEGLAPHGFLLHAQEGGDLGERLAAFFDWYFDHGIERVVVVGSDSPTLPGALIEQALEALYHAPAVVGPCYDGGYYLIGLSRSAPEVFHGIDWGSERVFAQTMKRLRSAGMTFRALDPWYDVDTAESLAFLIQHLEALAEMGSELLPRNTIEVVRELGLRDDEE